MSSKGVSIYSVDAVLDRDLVEILKQIGLFEDVVANRCQCAECGRVINLGNLGAMKSLGGKKYAWICDYSECLTRAAEDRDSESGED